jgi:hypothetical protein
MVTIKRVDIVSAMKVGALLNALVVTVVSVLFFACNSLFFGSMAASISSLNAQAGGSPINTSSFAVASLTGCLVSYLILVVVAALSGAVLGLLYAFFYNVISNWAGGLRVELAPDQLGTLPIAYPELDKPKRSDSEDEFRF